MRLSEKTIDKLVAEALAMEAEEAKEAGAIGYMARAFVPGHAATQKGRGRSI